MKDDAKHRKQKLYQHLKRQVLTLQLRPGADLDEVRLSEEFGLSRTPLREVFRQMSGEGYLELRAGRSARVSEMSYMTLRDFFLAAPMVYGAILRLAAQNTSTAQVAALKTAQEAFKSALRTGAGADRALANTRFHEITGEMAGNIYLLPSFHRLLIDHARIGMTFYRPQNVQMAGRLSEASDQHDRIIAAIEMGDDATAARLADEHWALSRNQIEYYAMPTALDVPLGEFPGKKPA